MNRAANETVPPANQGGMRIRHKSDDSFDSSDQDGIDAENYHFIEASHPLQVKTKCCVIRIFTSELVLGKN